MFTSTTLIADCKTPQIAEQAVKECQGRKHCITNVADSLFGDLCPQNSQKYLEVVYTCGKSTCFLIIILQSVFNNIYPNNNKKKKTDFKYCSNIYEHYFL